jgi:hypothetical protein
MTHGAGDGSHTLQPLPLPPHCLKSDFWVLHGGFVGAAGLGQVTAGP